MGIKRFFAEIRHISKIVGSPKKNFFFRITKKNPLQRTFPKTEIGYSSYVKDSLWNYQAKVFLKPIFLRMLNTNLFYNKTRKMEQSGIKQLWLSGKQWRLLQTHDTRQKEGPLTVLRRSLFLWVSPYKRRIYSVELRRSAGQAATRICISSSHKLWSFQGIEWLYIYMNILKRLIRNDSLR